MINKTRKIISIILLLFGMAFVFMFSAMDGDTSTKTSKSIVELSPEDINKDAYTEHEMKQKMREENKLTVLINKRIRKTAHFVEFCVLAIIVIFTLKSFNMRGHKAYLFALILVFIYACTDELHQLFISGRDARFLDVMIDSLGGILGCMIYAAVSELLVEINEKKAKL